MVETAKPGAASPLFWMKVAEHAPPENQWVWVGWWSNEQVTRMSTRWVWRSRKAQYYRSPGAISSGFYDENSVQIKATHWCYEPEPPKDAQPIYKVEIIAYRKVLRGVLHGMDAAVAPSHVALLNRMRYVIKLPDGTVHEVSDVTFEQRDEE